MQLSLCHRKAGDFLYEIYKEEALLLGICKSKPSDKQVCHRFITFHLLLAAKKKRTNKIQEQWFNFFIVENQSNVEKPTTLIPHRKDGMIDRYLGMVSSNVSKVCICKTMTIVFNCHCCSAILSIFIT